MILALVEILLFYNILGIILNFSHGGIFVFGRRPLIWMAFCLLLGFAWFAFAGGFMKYSVSVSCWSAIIAYYYCSHALPSAPPLAERVQILSDLTEADRVEMEESERIAKEIGWYCNPRKHRLGLRFFLFGAVVGWMWFYGSIGK